MSAPLSTTAVSWRVWRASSSWTPIANWTSAPAASSATCNSNHRPGELAQKPHIPQAGMAAAADDDVIVHRDPQGFAGRDDLLGDGDVGARWGRIARRVVHHYATDEINYLNQYDNKRHAMMDNTRVTNGWIEAQKKRARIGDRRRLRRNRGPERSKDIPAPPDQQADRSPSRSWYPMRATATGEALYRRLFPQIRSQSNWGARRSPNRGASALSRPDHGNRPFTNYEYGRQPGNLAGYRRAQRWLPQRIGLLP